MNFDKPYEDFCKINCKIITKVLTHNTIQSQNYKFDKRDGGFDRILAIEKENLQLIPPDKRRPYFIATDEIDPPTQGQVVPVS